MGPVLLLQYARKNIKPMIVAGLLAAAIDATLSALLIPGSGVSGAVTASAVRARAANECLRIMEPPG